jgi:Restriction endonuclease
MAAKTISILTPTEFENMTYDLLQVVGMKTLVWRTPGADGGRDIEGVFPIMDLSGHFSQQRWYVECKRYSSSIDWPTVYRKVAHADANGADFLLLVTNSNPSPDCESEIANWNESKRTVRIRAWRGYELDRILTGYPSVAAKHGLLEGGGLSEISFQRIMLELMKAAQASYVANQLRQDASAGLEAGAALSELVSLRMDQLRTYGRTLPPVPAATAPDYQWLDWNGLNWPWDEAGLRAFLAFFRYATGAKRVRLETVGIEGKLVPIEARCRLTDTVRRTLVEVALWSDIEISSLDDGGATLSMRAPSGSSVP